MTNVFDKIKRKQLLHSLPLLLLFLLGMSANNPSYFFTYMIPWVGFFYLLSYYLFPQLLQKKNLLLNSTLICIAGFVCFSLLLAIDIQFNLPISQELSFGKLFLSSWPFHPIKQDAIISLISLLTISSIYALIRYLILSKRKRLIKRIAIYTSVLALLILLISGTKYLIDISWEGNEDIQFLATEDYGSLTEVLRLPQFRNQLVYVDLWYSSCGPCINEFKHLPQLKKQLADKAVSYLYLAHETSRPHDRQLWKNTIKKYELTGYHLFMSTSFDEGIWAKISQKTGIPARYPHYLLIGENGQIREYDAARPSGLDRLITQMDGMD